MGTVRAGMCLLMVLAGFACRAEDLPPPESPDVIRGRIAAVVEAHAQTIGCAVVVDGRHVLEHATNRGRFYIALYHADVGCSGGTAMSRPVLVVVRPGAYDKYFIDARHSTPRQTPDSLPPIITDLALEGGRIAFKGLALNPTDALCCHSRVVTGHLRLHLDADPVWTVD